MIPAAGDAARVYGVIDLLRGSKVAGWAVDRASAAASVDVDIYREGELVTTVRAERHRKDLANGGLGTGSYGFMAELATPIEPGFEFTIAAVARSKDGESAALKRGAGKAVDPERRLLERTFEQVAALHARLSGLDATLEKRAEAPTAQLTELLERMEMVQLRLEASLGKVDAPPPASSPTGMRLWVGFAVLVGLASLALGIASMLAG